ncbi:MAG: hypothetical protein AAF518_22630 [Spirochaetota bacterium]
MAIWQYTFTVIPTTRIFDGIIKLQYDEDGLLKDHVHWQDLSVNVSFFEAISFFISRGKSWSDKTLLWGDIDSNCFKILHEDNLVESVSFRIDFTVDYKEFLDAVLGFIKEQNLILLDERHQITEPNYLSIKNLMENSHQAKLYHKLSSKE